MKKSAKKTAKKLTKKYVYVLCHVNSDFGPPMIDIDSVYATRGKANAAMKRVLQDFYEVTPKENEDNDYMFVSKHTMYS